MKKELEYAVRDFLEMRCFLKEPEQKFLLDFLKEKDLKAEAIRAYPAFSIEDCLVVIMDGSRTRQRWLYHPGKKLIEG